MKAIFFSLFLSLMMFSATYASSLHSPFDKSIIRNSNLTAPCWAEAHYYGLAQDENGDIISGCHIVLVLVKCQFENDPAPNLVAWGFTAVGDCPESIRVTDDVFYSSNATKVGYSMKHRVSSNDTLKDYLAAHPNMKIKVADAAVDAIPN